MSLSAAVGKSFLSASFLQVDVGSETAVVEQLKNSGHTSIFKVFGRYDILSLFDIQDFEDEKIYSSCDGVRITRALTAYSFITKIYTSPDIYQWSRDASVIGFVSLELDKWLYSPESPSGSVLTAITILIDKLNNIASENNLDIAIYGGYGRAELYAIVKTSMLDDIWFFTGECRNLICANCFDKYDKDDANLPVFVRTRTTPCISYNNIKYEVKDVAVTSVEGECTGSIIVNCPSGFENYIPEYFPKDKKYSYAGLMGDDDGAIFTNGKKSTKEFLEDILNFRFKWGELHNAPIITRTYLQDINIIKNEQTTRKINDVQSYKVNYKILQINIPPILQKNNPKLSNRIKTFLYNLNSCSGNRSYQAVVLCIENYIDYIQQQIDVYRDLSGLNQHIAESKLLEAIETAENGLAQRIDSSFEASYLDHKIPLPFGDGIFSSLVAIEQLINHIFEVWSSCNPDYKGRAKANGFPTFNDATGFGVRWGETINLPLVAIYDPCDSKGNWNTLTHEISHAIYTRLNFLNVHEDKLKEIHKSKFKNRSINMNYDDVYEDQVFELFAHWYDYYHFYDCNINEYIRQVWLSWLQIPIVHVNFSEYFFRSMFVYFSDNIEKIYSCPMQKNSSEKIRDVLQSLWDEHIKCIKDQVVNFPAVYLEEKILPVKKNIITLFYAYIDILKLFEKYKNDDFRIKINEKYDEFELHRDNVINGQLILSGVVNPYVIVKEIISNKLDNGDLRTATAMIMTLKNSTWFYTNANMENEGDN